MKTRKFIAIITAVIMLLSVGTMNAFAVETYSSNVLTPQDVTAYEDILDRLNDEYGYSMYFLRKFLLVTVSLKTQQNIHFRNLKQALEKKLKKILRLIWSLKRQLQN